VFRGLAVSQSNPLGRSTASFGAALALSRSITSSIGERGSPRAPVPAAINNPRGIFQQLRQSRRTFLAPKTSIGTSVFARIAKLVARIARQLGRTRPKQHANRMTPQIEMPARSTKPSPACLPCRSRSHGPAMPSRHKHVGHAPPRVASWHIEASLFGTGADGERGAGVADVLCRLGIAGPVVICCGQG